MNEPGEPEIGARYVVDERDELCDQSFIGTLSRVEDDETGYLTDGFCLLRMGCFERFQPLPDLFPIWMAKARRLYQ